MKRFAYLKKRGYSVHFSSLPEQCFGICDHQKKEILIDPYMNIYDTFIHEYLHARYPKKSEDQIYKMTIRVRMRTSRKQIRKEIIYLLIHTKWV